MRSARVLVVVTVMMVGLSRNTAGQVTGTTGAELFASYCSSCHGEDGKHAGPTAIALKFSTPDLTTIAQRNGGTFPAERITAFIVGPDKLFIPAHGSSRMPVWGPAFRALDPASDSNARVAQIVAYLKSLQVK